MFQDTLTVVLRIQFSLYFSQNFSVFNIALLGISRRSKQKNNNKKKMKKMKKKKTKKENKKNIFVINSQNN